MCTCGMCLCTCACVCVVCACACVCMCAYARVVYAGVCGVCMCGVCLCVCMCVHTCVVCAGVCGVCLCVCAHVWWVFVYACSVWLTRMCTCARACVLCLCMHRKCSCQSHLTPTLKCPNTALPETHRHLRGTRHSRASSRRRGGDSTPGEVICSRRSAPGTGAPGAWRWAARGVSWSGNLIRVPRGAPGLRSETPAASRPCENRIREADGSVLNFYVIGKMK